MTINSTLLPTQARRSGAWPTAWPSCRLSPILIRSLLVLMLAILFSTQSGCQILHRFGQTPQPIPVIYEDLPTQQQLLETIQERRQAARQLNTDVRVSMAGVPKINGTIQVEFPNRLRMKAGVAGISELGVDVGCNEEEFWVWSKAALLPGQEPTLYFAKHDAFQGSSVRRAIPFDPKWLIDAIGVIEFSPADVHYGPIKDSNGRLRLFTVRQMPTGQQTRVTLFGASSGLIEQQAIYDSSDKLVAYSNSSHYKNYPQDHVSLPQRIELHMIQPDGSDAKVVVELGTFSVNSLFGDPSKMWAMPAPAGVNKVDLTQVPQSNASLGRGSPAY